MEFVAAKCPNCGGDLRLPDDKKSVKCMYCSFDIIVKEAINQAGVNVENLLKLASSAEQTGNYQEAYDYFTKVLEYEPHNYLALFGKGISAGKLSTVFNFRSEELINGINQALNNIPKDKKKELEERACQEIYSAFIKFKEIRDAQLFSSLKKNDLFNSLSEDRLKDIALKRAVECLEIAHTYCSENEDILAELELGYKLLILKSNSYLTNPRVNETEHQIEFERLVGYFETKKDDYLSKLKSVNPERANSIMEARKSREEYLENAIWKPGKSQPSAGNGCLISIVATVLLIFLVLISL